VQGAVTLGGDMARVDLEQGCSGAAAWSKVQLGAMQITYLLTRQAWWGAGVVICLERGANDLHMIQLMPLPLHHLSLQ